MSEPQDTTRPLVATDYADIWKRIEEGFSREAVLRVYPIKMETLNKRMSAERPDLWKKFKALPTAVRVEGDERKRGALLIQAMAAELQLDAVELVGHNFRVAANKARKQREDQLADPQKVLTPVGLEDARNYASLMKVAAMVPGTGLQAGGGTNVTLNTQINHASAMRRGDNSGVLASDDDIAGAIVDTKETP